MNKKLCKCGKEKYKSYYYCKECNSKMNKEYFQKKFDGNYYVYYLPEDNYCGITKTLQYRMYAHKAGTGYGRKKRNIEGWTVLYSSPCIKDAHYHEALFHSVLCMEGLNIRNDKKKIK